MLLACFPCSGGFVRKWMVHFSLLSIGDTMGVLVCDLVCCPLFCSSLLMTLSSTLVCMVRDTAPWLICRWVSGHVTVMWLMWLYVTQVTIMWLSCDHVTQVSIMWLMWSCLRWLSCDSCDHVSGDYMGLVIMWLSCDSGDYVTHVIMWCQWSCDSWLVI